MPVVLAKKQNAGDAPSGLTAGDDAVASGEAEVKVEPGTEPSADGKPAGEKKSRIILHHLGMATLNH